MWEEVGKDPLRHQRVGDVLKERYRGVDPGPLLDLIRRHGERAEPGVLTSRVTTDRGRLEGCSGCRWDPVTHPSRSRAPGPRASTVMVSSWARTRATARPTRSPSISQSSPQPISHSEVWTNESW